MPDWASELLRYGPLGAFALAVCWGGWLALKHGGSKALVLGERYVSSTEKLHDTLKESMDKQQGLCEAHATEIGGLSAILEEQKMVSLAAQKGLSESNEHLRQLVVLHEQPGAIHNATVEITMTNHDVARVKQAVVRACSMCREIAAVEFPNSAVAVAGHCDAIQQIINSESGSGK